VFPLEKGKARENKCKKAEAKRMAWLDKLKRILRLPVAGKDCVWSRLQREGAEEKAYQRWVEKKTYLNWMPFIFKAYHFKKCKINSPFRLQLMQSSHKKGVILFYSPEIGKQNFRHLFEFIKDQGLRAGYQHHLSDQRVISHERYTETIDKHYLKPPAVDVPGSRLCNQLYGNLMVDMVSINGQPGFIRFYVNTYHDALFSEPLPFDELMDKVFNLEPA
jgi:hypothetical protein